MVTLHNIKKMTKEILREDVHIEKAVRNMHNDVKDVMEENNDMLEGSGFRAIICSMKVGLG